MADVLHRTTKRFLKSVNDPDYPVRDWVLNPVVGGQRMRSWIGSAARRAPRYVNIVGDVVTEMTEGEKDAQDAADSNAARLAEKESQKDLLSDDRFEAILGLIVDTVNGAGPATIEAARIAAAAKVDSRA